MDLFQRLQEEVKHYTLPVLHKANNAHTLFTKNRKKLCSHVSKIANNIFCLKGKKHTACKNSAPK